MQLTFAKVAISRLGYICLSCYLGPHKFFGCATLLVQCFYRSAVVTKSRLYCCAESYQLLNSRPIF